MKTFMIAAGVLAFSATSALAQSAYEYRGGDVSMERQVAVEPGYADQSMYGGPSPAQGFAPQNDTQALDSTPNTGAGTSKSSAANNG